MKFSIAKSLKTKITFSVSLLTILSFLIITIIILSTIHGIIKKEVVEKGMFKIEALSWASVSSFFLEDIESLEKLSSPYIDKYVNLIAFLHPDGGVLAQFGKYKFSVDKALIKWAVSVEKPSVKSFVINREKNFIFSAPILEEKEKQRYEKIGFTMMVVSYKAIYSKLVPIVALIIPIYLILSCITIVIMMSFLTKEVINPITSISDTLYKISEEKNLGLKIETYKKDEIGRLVESVNGMLSSFKEIILSIIKSSKVVADATSGILRSLQQQTQSVQQVTSTISQVSHSIGEVSSASQAASALLNDGKEMATSGKKVISETSQKMEAVYSGVNSALNSSQKLNTKSRDIAEIANMITKIADQTNLLSLNAAIEAARAGEAGRGFAVVADEIRKLADTSSQQAQKISHILNEVVADVNESMKITEGVLNQCKDALKFMNSASKLFEDIANVVDKCSLQVEQVASLSEETSSAAEEVSATMQEQLAATENISAQSGKLNEVVEELNKQVQQFKV